MTLKRTEAEVLSQRYAKSLFDYSSENNLGEALSADLNTLSKLISESSELSRAISSPLVSKESLQKTLEEIISKAGLNTELKKFISVIAKNRRGEIIAKVAEKLAALFDAQNNRVKVEVTSAVELSEADIKNISEKVASFTSAKPVIKSNVDKSIIGGLKVKIGSKLFDDSVKTRLENIKISLNS